MPVHYIYIMNCKLEKKIDMQDWNIMKAGNYAHKNSLVVSWLSNG